MLSSSFDKSIELFDRRFVTNAYLPMVLATGGATFVVLSGTQKVSEVAVSFDHLGPIAQGGVLLGWLGASWFLAGMLWNSRYSITRVFEGYALRHRGGILGWIDRRLTKRQRRTADFFTGSVRFKRYPMHASQFLPTSFGNVMRASELYGEDRYGLDLIVLWPRLVEVAPDRYRSDVDEARSEYEFLLCLSFLGVAFGSFSGAYLAVVGGPLVVYLACVPSTLGLALLSYRLGVFAAIDFGDQLRVVVDIYRLDALRYLGWPMPDTDAEERKYWTEVTEFLGQNVPIEGGRPIQIAALRVTEGTSRDD